MAVRLLGKEVPCGFDPHLWLQQTWLEWTQAPPF